MKTPDEFHSDALKRLAKYQELLVAKQTKAKIYVISDGDTFIWFNPLTEEHIPVSYTHLLCRRYYLQCQTRQTHKRGNILCDHLCDRQHNRCSSQMDPGSFRSCKMCIRDRSITAQRLSSLY